MKIDPEDEHGLRQAAERPDIDVRQPAEGASSQQLAIAADKPDCDANGEGREDEAQGRAEALKQDRDCLENEAQVEPHDLASDFP